MRPNLTIASPAPNLELLSQGPVSIHYYYRRNKTRPTFINYAIFTTSPRDLIAYNYTPVYLIGATIITFKTSINARCLHTYNQPRMIINLILINLI